jgi:hypothetical protein
MLGLILFILALLNMINFIGILIGFTVIFILILREGLRTARDYQATTAGDELKQPLDPGDMKQ